MDKGDRITNINDFSITDSEPLNSSTGYSSFVSTPMKVINVGDVIKFNTEKEN